MRKGNFTLLIVAIVFLFSSPALAELNATDPCEWWMTWGDNDWETCSGVFKLSEMGTIDGTNFDYSVEFVHTLDHQGHHSTPSNHPDEWAPVSELLYVNNNRIDVQRYPDSTNRKPRTRAVLGALINAWTYPRIWMMENGDIHVEWEWCNESGCSDTPRFIAAGDPLPLTFVHNVVWHHPVKGDLAISGGGDEEGSYLYIDYSMDSKMWEPQGWSTYQEIYFTPWYGEVAPIGSNDFTVNFTVASGFDPHHFTVVATDDRIMPTVPATSKKRVWPKELTKKKKAHLNILVREVDNPQTPEIDKALVVQWPVPDGALFGGMQLRMFVGHSSFPEPDGIYRPQFLWVNSPAQTGTVTIPAAQWREIQDIILSKGETEARISFQYRVTSTDFSNRGYSEGVSYPVTPATP